MANREAREKDKWGCQLERINRINLGLKEEGGARGREGEGDTRAQPSSQPCIYLGAGWQPSKSKNKQATPPPQTIPLTFWSVLA